MRAMPVLLQSALTLMSCALTTVAYSQISGEIVEYAVNGAQELAAITAGADGNLWVIDPRTSKILRISRTGTITEFQLTASAYPADITAGPDGNVWYARRGEIGKITPNGEVTAYKVDGLLSGITAGPDGNLWFCENFRGKIGRATQDGQVTMFDIPTRPGGGSSNPLSIAAGPDGKLWFTETNPKANKIGCVTTDGQFTEHALPHEGTPRGVASGPDGNLWVLQTVTFPEEDRVFSVTTGGVIVEHVFAGVKTSMAQTIVSGPDGNLWFTEPNNPSTKVSRLTTSGELTRFSVPTPFSGPAGMTVGPDGNVWFTERAKSKISRIQTAAPNTEYVLHLPSGFVPTTVQIEQGQSVVWVNKMPGQSTVQQEGKAPLFDSARKGTGSNYSFKFSVAGTYPYIDSAHESHTGTVVVPMKVTPANGSKTTKFELTWATGADPVVPDGWVIDVEVSVPGKDEFAKWQDGVTAKSAAYTPTAGEGTYRFRTRVRHSATMSTSDWSPIASITVR